MPSLRAWGRKTPEGRSDFFEEAEAYTDYLCTHVEGARFLVKTEDKHVGRTLFTKQGRGDSRVLLRSVMAIQALLGDDAIAGRTFIDVGANIGTTTVPALLSHPFAAAVALEPEPENFTTLRLNLVLNGLEGRAKTLQAAASNAVGELDLVVNRSRSGKHWISIGITRRAKAGEVQIKVPTVTLDSLAADGVFQIDRIGLLWIDAENHEGQILGGASDLTQQGVPVVFEWDPKGLDHRGDRVALQEIVGEHYTHFVDMRRRNYELLPSSTIADYETMMDAQGERHFTEILVLRLAPHLVGKTGSIKPLMEGAMTPESAFDDYPSPQTGSKKVSGVAARSKRLRKLLKLTRKRWKHTKRRLRTVSNMRYRPTYRSTIHRVPSRNELPVLLNKRKLLGRGAEIGVKTGKYSERLLDTWRGEQLISIDPWLSADPDEYVDRSNVSQGQFEQYLRETKERLAPFGSRSEIWRLTSVEGAAKVEDGSLDFVYIDARHDYESVLEDLNAWFSKLKPGGILAGHDYADGLFPQGDFGVKSAVDEFFAERGLPVHATQGPSAVELFPSWVVEIPREPIPAPAPDRREPTLAG